MRVGPLPLFFLLEVTLSMGGLVKRSHTNAPENLGSQKHIGHDDLDSESDGRGGKERRQTIADSTEARSTTSSTPSPTNLSSLNSPTSSSGGPSIPQESSTYVPSQSSSSAFTNGTNASASNSAPSSTSASKHTHTTAVVVGVVIPLLAIAFACAIILYRRRGHRHQSSGAFHLEKRVLDLAPEGSENDSQGCSSAESLPVLPEINLESGLQFNPTEVSDPEKIGATRRTHTHTLSRAPTYVSHIRTLSTVDRPEVLCLHISDLCLQYPLPCRLCQQIRQRRC
ncbi:hypothetical protein K438DRAFT_1823468, partial [Mycena galopus ATCC 62051]